VGSGLIYAAIAIMWAAVLIPMWLRNHDTATENRSAERFGQAMRVLSRKEGAPPVRDEGATVVAEQRSQQAPRPQRAQQPQRTQRPERTQRPPRPQRAPLTLIQRRARTLGVLTGLTFVTVLLGAITPLPWWAAVPFVLLTLAFVVHLRVQARQRMQLPRQRATTPTPKGSTDPQTTDGPESRDESGVVQGPSRAVVVERKGDGAAASPDLDDDAWRPNPLPLPTYVTAPKAVRPIKVIDLTTPGAWSSGRLFDDDLAEEDLLAAQVAEDELDALLDQEVAPPNADGEDASRRAVGD
jgi:hypothetical protein